MQKGLIHVYTGDGKGKSTAAFGLAVRALGANKKVHIIQFLKSSETSELKTFAQLKPGIEAFRFEKSRGFVWTLSDEQKQELAMEIREAFAFACATLQDRTVDVLILDEILGTISHGFLSSEEICMALQKRCVGQEVVLTGRNVPADIQEIADYVSEITCIKHPYQKGVQARQGIEF